MNGTKMTKRMRRRMAKETCAKVLRTLLALVFAFTLAIPVAALATDGDEPEGGDSSDVVLSGGGEADEGEGSGEPGEGDVTDEGDTPGESGEGGDPDEPGDGNDPNEPGEGDTPDEPGDGDDPVAPGSGDEPDTPDDGDMPDEPGSGDDPDTPVGGDDPDEPGAGDDPEEPGAGDEPEEPGEGDSPEEPGDDEDDGDILDGIDFENFDLDALTSEQLEALAAMAPERLEGLGLDKEQIDALQRAYVLSTIDFKEFNQEVLTEEQWEALVSLTYDELLALGLSPEAIEDMGLGGVELRALPNPLYSWYVGHESDSQYIIEDERAFLGFINLVNGTTDGVVDDPVDFAGKTVLLDFDLVYSTAIGDELIPIGTPETPFCGVFDGQDCAIGNFNVSTSQGDSNLGLFGYVCTKSGYPTAAIKNLIIDTGASLTITRDVASGEGAVPLSNIGCIVGYIDGDLIGCISRGVITITNAMHQTADVTYVIKNVGGLAGICLGNITNCTNEATVVISSTGDFSMASEGYTIVLNVGGIVGCFGDEDSSINPSTSRRHGTITNCTNTGSITVTVSPKTYEDRFGNKDVTLQVAGVGGIAGYSRGSIIGCVNKGLFDAQRSRDMGGIVGQFRARMGSSNFASEGSDDGLVSGAGTIVIRECRNMGSLVGYAMVGGICGRAGTNTVIEACLNGILDNGAVATGSSKVYILATRSTKPFPAGICGATYGIIRYCGNFGEVATAFASSINISSLSSYSAGDGYYASGICGIVEYFTDASGAMCQSMPEVYGCFNAGPAISRGDQFRNRSIVGDNEGYVHDNIAVSGTAPEMFFTESELGTVARCYEVTGTQAKTNEVFDTTLGLTALGVLNFNADGEGWTYYWTTSNGTVNSGYVVLSSQVTWPLSSLATATVTWAGDAEYTGLEAVPLATVVLDGVTLTQNVDFRVVPQSGATECSYETPEKDYTATVVGVGAYTGTATQTFDYDITRGNLANCTVVIENKPFNWEGQQPTNVSVINAGGQAVPAAEYTFVLDSTDPDLTNGQAVNAKSYTVIITAVADAAHYYGTVTGEFAITAVKLISGASIQITGITYNGDESDWQSTSGDEIPEEDRWAAAFTGHPIKPTVNGVTFLGQTLTEGVDYLVYYGDGYQMAGQTPDETPNTEPGDGWIMVRGYPGGNFTNYDMMRFTIYESEDPLDIADATVTGDDDIVFEYGAYEPIIVSYGGSELTRDTDYTIVYENNDAVGVATYTITGIGLFGGTKTGTFNLVQDTTYEFTYTLNHNTGTATITGVKYYGSLDTFTMVIPETIEVDGVEYTVTAIAEKAFGGSAATDYTGSETNLSKHKIGAVVIPAAVTSIGTRAFGGGSSGNPNMAQLTSVTFAEGSQLTTIGDYAFTATGITEVTIPAGVQSIGKGAFGATPLETITFLSEEAGIPATYYHATGAVNTFYHVNNVQAYAYDVALPDLRDSVSNDTWTWNSLGGVPVEITVEATAVTESSVTASATVAPESDGAVTYALVATNEAPAADDEAWQEEAVFAGLTGETTYYLFAQIAATDVYDAAVSAGVEVTTPAAPAKLWGDVDGSGDVTARDATFVARYAVGKIGADKLDLSVADVDGQGGVTARDATFIARRASGRIVQFPVEQ